MSLLLDTHALIWFLAGDSKLPSRARDRIEQAGDRAMVSAVSALEIVNKHRLGKLPEAAELATDFEHQLALNGFSGLAISVRHAEFAGRLTVTHRDPFDRLLIAQAILEDLTLVSNETVFDQTGVSRLW